MLKNHHTQHHINNRKNYLSDCFENNNFDLQNGSSTVNKSRIKHKLRTGFLKQRRLLSNSEIQEKSSKIARNLIGHPVFTNSKTIALYSPIHSEVDTSLILKHANQLGKQVCFPKVFNNTLKFYLTPDLSLLKPGKFGIPEPADSKDYEIDTDKIDLFLIPCVCVDIFGNRIGYGKGYYDRALTKTDSNKKVGLVYDFQITGDIPTGHLDKHMGFIATESAVIQTSRGGNYYG